ncbi:filamentous hemagglutinin N-terminal domain-containing protein [Arsenophonus endosymbiont of Aleurodicus floccissimus]|uniref:filamentous hemagglutinin N-terminal domain-containing protein n=1 Tax=Arsenophonus endosymbiont of Aleurodicus floccissimus TaxID=2152761 RepID=UPI000E6AED6A|nr:filamentous hemagglutinin N-terminal domain-containing protein [Arsenophonus endosymbiont of Aleurodicus floccissimus]
MKTTLIFIMAITIMFNSYADDLHIIKDRLPTENRKLKKNNKDNGTYIIIDENNIKNSTASITKYKNYSKLNRLLSDSTNRNKPVININPIDNKGVSHIFNKMDIGKKGIYINNNIELSAKLIITEIDRNEKTRLLGELAILGTKAAILIANQQGISCISCSFSGTDRVTLLAGKINLGYMKKLIILNQSMNKSISFSGNINFNNIKILRY